jgi:hypothetical protein
MDLSKFTDKIEPFFSLRYLLSGFFLVAIFIAWMYTDWNRKGEKQMEEMRQDIYRYCLILCSRDEHPNEPISIVEEEFRPKSKECIDYCNNEYEKLFGEYHR